MNRLLHLHSRQENEPSQKCRLLVLHVGVADVFTGTKPEDVIEAIHEKAASYAPRLIICSVPDVTVRGKELIARSIIVNAALRKLCASLKATFLDNGELFEGDGHLTGDGTHYRTGLAKVMVEAHC